ncbi:hypothetical protein BAUCODRAFT_36908 [Baudoinia panamericana UAMH 10762]|uniref:Exonuclease domain-containing protein n=1 Tax=Baudoinia panamericana (strain UAMH 10762) TaxID=717646 RepID=M2N3D8_BAUPA|nr:uncharacterized protein BAUCODRAFT_36908 [Baudoinia panamericana UAMH 10762]EMC93235.1 hypothetical protein BAUCODRAFT_36908 [Baudoinia panamericana UAMH 10762]
MTRLKRSRDETDNDHFGMGSTVSLLNGQSGSTTNNNTQHVDSPASTNGNGDADGWQQVEGRKAKRRKKQSQKQSDNYPSITHSSHARLQASVKISDLQNLALYLLADGNAPQWISVRHHGAVRKVVVLMVPGLEAGMFDNQIPLLSTEEETADGAKETTGDGHSATGDSSINSQPVPRKLNISPDDFYPVRLVRDRLPEPLQPLSDVFEHIWPIRTPGDDKYARMHSPLAAMLTAPIVKTREEKKAKGPQPPPEGKAWRNQRTPVTELLATTDELCEGGYVLHPAHYEGTPLAQAEIARREANKSTASDRWVDVPGIPSLESGDPPEEAIQKGSVTAGRKVFAMDCEMCITSPSGVTPQVFSLTRVSIVDWDGNTVLDELVKPSEPITDYLTPYSGITAALLENVTTTLSDIQRKLCSIFTPQSVLVGHSLNSDMNALRMTHPFIVDTTFLFPHPRGPPLKSSLKWLAQKYLSREIQKGHGKTGHDSIEDAKACLDLVKQKCEKGKAWGTPEASGESIFKRLARTNRPKRDKVHPSGEDEPRMGAVVDWGDPARGYGGQAKVTIGCESDAEVVAGVERATKGDDTNAVVPLGGCDFTWARLRELEAFRGWWDKSKLVDSDALRSSTQAASVEETLASVVKQTAENVQAIYDSLPPCTAFIVYSGSGSPIELRELTWKLGQAA